MIFESPQALQSSSFKPSVCIIGSGPAGISLALKLERKKIPCLIVEAGGFEYDAEVQDAYRSTVVGDPYYDLAIARLRFFGGTSGHWAGWCRPLDEVDFEPRSGIDKSGWPLRKKHLDPYAAETQSILEILAIQPDDRLNDRIKEVHLSFSPPVRFGKKYRKQIEASPLIGLLTYSPVVDIVPVRDRIDHVKVRDRQGGLHPIAARMFCVCTGGIENSRMLLWSNRLHGGGVVPKADALGRYWMEHPHIGVGEAVLFTFTGMRVDKGMRFYAPTPQFMQAQQIGNFGVRLFAGESLTKALIRDGLCHSPKFFEDLAKKADAGLVCGAEVRLAWEQVPVATNRIELDEASDANGMARTKLFWKKGPLERRTAVTAMQQFAGYLAESDRGRVKIASWLTEGKDYPEEAEKAGFHHMGGTRMAASPADGVVDSDCKVFGVDNLYVGGASVFPTGGHSNPTYTIVQLALRIGDHIAGRLQAGA